MYAGTARTVISTLKARSDDQVLTIQFFGSKNWKQALGRPDFKVPFCGANVGRSFVVCSHHRFSELRKNLQFGAKMIMRNLSVLFIFQREYRMKIEQILFPSVFSKLQIRFSEPTNNLITHRVNGPLKAKVFYLTSRIIGGGGGVHCANS